MTLFLFVLAGILIAAMRGRKDRTFTPSQIVNAHALWLPVAGFLLHGLFDWAPSFALRTAGPLTLSYELCILLFFFFNRKERFPAILMTAGTLSNFAVIAANHFRMPVSPAALAMYPGLTPEAVAAKKVNYFIASNGSRLYLLADVIPLPLGKLSGFISVGDLLLGVGLMLFTARMMIRLPKPEELTM
jgi:hypothetical protein